MRLQLFRDIFKKITMPDNDLVLKGLLSGSRAFTGPSIVQFDITNRCNNSCLCCWNNSPLLGEASLERQREKECELPVKLVKDVIKELAAMGTRNLFFAGGGEPFMHPHIMDILAFAKKNKMKIFMNTNFTLVEEKFVKEIVDLKIDLIHVSLLAGTAETYCSVHPNQTKETFYKIKEQLKYLSHLRCLKNQESPTPFPHIDLYYVIFNKNYHEIDKMADLAMELKANTLEFTPIDVISGKTDILLLNEEQKKFVVEEVIKQKNRIDKFNQQHGGRVTFIEQYDSFIKRMSSQKAAKGEYEENTVGQRPCYVGWVFARVLANGDVNPCLKAHKISIGNIYKQSFKEIWNSQKEQTFRNKALKLDRRDGYFKIIGNNPDSEFGCLNSCDNIQINLDMHNKYRDILKEHGKT